jgi:hypothetical protein
MLVCLFASNFSENSLSPQSFVMRQIRQVRQMRQIRQVRQMRQIRQVRKKNFKFEIKEMEAALWDQLSTM